MVAQTIVRQLDTAREHVNLVGALSHIAKETFDSVRRLHVTMHALRKRVKREQMLLVLNQTAHRFPDSAEHTWL
jgi:hypothetical protein